jgi:hypothetical protein
MLIQVRNRLAERLCNRTKSDVFTVRVAKKAEEAKELLKVGFDYITEFECLRLFRKRN